MPSIPAWIPKVGSRAELPASRGSVQAGQVANAYRAVQVRSGLDSCGAVDAVKSQRFLASAAPMLPLPDCDRVSCGCRYDKFSDRRSGEDRRLIAQHRNDLYVGHERRQQKGRRATDL